jgi:MFS family permease
VDGLETALVAGALPLLQDEWGFSDTLGGAIPTAASISGLLVTLPAGYLADRFPRTRLLAVVVTSWALLTTASALATAFWMFFVVRVVLGAANSLDNPSASSLITDYHPPSARSRVFAVQRAAWTVGASGGIAVGGLLGDAFGWRTPFLVMAVPGLLVAWALHTLPEPGRNAADGDRAEVELPPPGAFRTDLCQLWRLPTIRAVYVGATVAYLGFNGIAYWLPSFWEREFDIVEGTAAALTGGLGITATVIGSALGGVLGDRWGGGDVEVRVGIAGAGLGGGGLLVVAGMALPGLAAQMLLLGIGACAIVAAAPNFAAVIGDVLPAHRRGIGYAFFTFVIVAGGALGPLVIGAVSDIAGSLRFALVVGLVPVAPGGVLVIRARRHAARDRAAQSAAG